MGGGDREPPPRCFQGRLVQRFWFLGVPPPPLSRKRNPSRRSYPALCIPPDLKKDRSEADTAKLLNQLKESVIAIKKRVEQCKFCSTGTREKEPRGKPPVQINHALFKLLAEKRLGSLLSTFQLKETHPK